MMTFNTVVQNTTPTIAVIIITPITKLTHPEPTNNPRRDSSSTDSNQTDRQCDKTVPCEKEEKPKRLLMVSNLRGLLWERIYHFV